MMKSTWQALIESEQATSLSVKKVEKAMATLYPTEQERLAIKRRADSGDKSATNYLELLDVCTQILESSNGIALARGLMGEHDDTYGEAIDDALSELMPVCYKIATAGWESLQWYVNEPFPQEAS